MTIFEQQIDPSQIDMAWTTPIFLLVFFVGIIIATAVIGLVTTFLIGKTKLPDIISGLAAFAGMAVCVITMFIAAVNPLPIDALTKPEFEKSIFTPLKLNDKPAVIDAYRNDINTAIDDKLSDYTVPDYATDNPQLSILDGGDCTQSIATVKDEKTYTLTPHWDYDRSTHTVKLTVDIKEGYHPNK